MGSGPNYVLDKGYLAEGSTAYAFGELVVRNGDGTRCARATSAGALVLGVAQEAVDAAKLVANPNKIVIDVRLLGISRVLAGAAIAVGERLGNNTTARAVPVTKAAAGAQPAEVFGIAMTAASGAGHFVDVLLTPGAQF